MAWIEVHQSLRDHRKILALADELDMPEPHVAGHCLYLWLWSLDNAAEGVLPKSYRIIARAAGWVGDPATFVAALVAAGMIDGHDDGTLRIHDWDDYTGKIVDRRERNKLAMREARAREKLERVQHVDNTIEPHDETCKATVPNSTVHNSTLPSKAVVPSKSSKVFVSMSSAERANNTTHTSKNSKGRQSTPATPPDTPTPMVDLSKLPQKVASKFLPEQIADEFEKWQEYANEKGYTNRSINHFADWLERIDPARIIPPHETELERLLRLSHGKADEKGLINGKTPSGWEYAISAAKFTAEEAERRAAHAAGLPPSEQTGLVHNGHDPSFTASRIPDTLS